MATAQLFEKSPGIFSSGHDVLWNDLKSEHMKASERPEMPSPYLAHDQERQRLTLKPGFCELQASGGFSSW